MNINEIKKQAQKELDEENFKKEVNIHKNYLRNKRSIWDKLFPYRIIIIKKEK